MASDPRRSSNRPTTAAPPRRRGTAPAAGSAEPRRASRPPRPDARNGELRGADRLLALDVPKKRRGKAAAPAARARSDRGKRKGRGWKQRTAISFGALLSVLVLLAALVIGYSYWRFSQIKQVELGLQSAGSGKPQNYLIVGSDSRSSIDKNDPSAGAFLGAGAPDSNSARSDTIMILRIDPKSSKAQILSLPRDLWVTIAGTNSHDRINAAFGRGRKVLAQTIQQQFGIQINHYIEVDFGGFRKIVDAIGGIPLYFDTPMRDTNTGLDIQSSGCVTLHGEQALALARARHLYYFQDGSWHYDGTSDLGRISRQQLLIQMAIPRAESKAFTNPIALNDLADTIVHNVTIDNGLSPGALVGLANRFRHFDSKHLVRMSVPTTPYTTPGGAEVLLLDSSKAQTVFAKFRDKSGPAEAAVSVKVLNGSGVNGQAANVGGALQRVGFQLAGTGDSSQLGLGQVTHTQIRYAADDKSGAVLLARHLSVDAELTPVAGMESGTVVLVTGTDFTTVLTAPRKLAGSQTPSTRRSSPTTSTSTTVVGRVPGEAPPGVHC